mgnify:CR=1 FL=1
MKVFNWYDLVSSSVLGHPWVSEDGVAPDRPLDSAILTRMKKFIAMNKMKKIALQVTAILYFSNVECDQNYISDKRLYYQVKIGNSLEDDCMRRSLHRGYQKKRLLD